MLTDIEKAEGHQFSPLPQPPRTGRYQPINFYQYCARGSQLPLRPPSNPSFFAQSPSQRYVPRHKGPRFNYSTQYNYNRPSPSPSLVPAAERQPYSGGRHYRGDYLSKLTYAGIRNKIELAQQRPLTNYSQERTRREKTLFGFRGYRSGLVYKSGLSPSKENVLLSAEPVLTASSNLQPNSHSRVEIDAEKAAHQ